MVNPGMKTPLSGIKVLDMGIWAAGPACCVILADWGADVIVVEPPTGGVVRGVVRQESYRMSVSNYNWLWEYCNAGKRGIVIDAKQEEGKKILYELVKESDVFVSNMRPRALEKLGVDYDTLSGINPRLIYCAITGYGPEGEDRDKPAFDEVGFWARSGIMAILGEPGTPLTPLRGAMGDLTTAGFAAGGIALALYARERTGVGQKVDASLLSAGIWVVGSDLNRTLASNMESGRLSRKDRVNPLWNTYLTRDERWIQLVMPELDRYWPLICRALDREDLINDPRFNSIENMAENNKAAISILDEIIGGKTVPELKEIFSRHEIAWSPAQTIFELTADPQVIANDYIVEYEQPTYGVKVRQSASPVKLSKTMVGARSAAPEFGQHTEEILLELGYNWDKIQRLKEGRVIN